MNSYLNLLSHIIRRGEDRKDRTGVGTRSVFGYQWEHDLKEGFPLLTTKKVHFKSVIIELLWFLRGDTNVRFLRDHGVTIWDEWADSDGFLGPVYGEQWRFWTDPRKAIVVNGTASFGTIDQIKNLIDGLRNDPFSRRHVVSCWNVADIEKMALPPCHTLFQCYVSTSKELSLHLYMRSTDAFLGLPFNIACYATLIHLLAELTGLTPGKLVISFGDLHIYSNHMDQVNEQIVRTPGELPKLVINKAITSIDGLCLDDFKLINYHHQPAIKAPIAV